MGNKSRNTDSDESTTILTDDELDGILDLAGGYLREYLKERPLWNDLEIAFFEYADSDLVKSFNINHWSGRLGMWSTHLQQYALTPPLLVDLHRDIAAGTLPAQEIAGRYYVPADNALTWLLARIMDCPYTATMNENATNEASTTDAQPTYTDGAVAYPAQRHGILPKHWSEITLVLRGNEEVTVMWRGTRAGMTYDQLGFTNRQTRKPTRAWEILHRFKKGEFLPHTEHGSQKNSSVSRQVSEINKVLKEYFGLSAPPVRQVPGYEGQNRAGWVIDLNVTEFM